MQKTSSAVSAENSLTNESRINIKEEEEEICNSLDSRVESPVKESVELLNMSEEKIATNNHHHEHVIRKDLLKGALHTYYNQERKETKLTGKLFNSRCHKWLFWEIS